MAAHSHDVGLVWRSESPNLLIGIKKSADHSIFLTLSTDCLPRWTGTSVLFHRSKLSIICGGPWAIKNWFGATTHGWNF